jgi:uncharacterized protein DUF3224
MLRATWEEMHRPLSLMLVLTVCGGVATYSQSPSPAPHKDASATMHAKGTFDVKVVPVSEDKADGLTLGRYSLDKQYHGDLEATAKGEMLSGAGEVKGSGAYVAVERVTGTLNGRTGSFLLVHKGTMGNGKMQLSVTVVPDSGTGQLTGLSGTLNIIIAEGKHSYEFEYSLPGAN